jgi:hypothetical protein
MTKAKDNSRSPPGMTTRKATTIATETATAVETEAARGTTEATEAD